MNDTTAPPNPDDIQKLATALRDAVLASDAGQATRIHRALWSAGGALHQALVPLLTPSLLTVSSAPEGPSHFPPAYAGLARLAATLDRDTAQFVSQRYLQALLASPRLPFRLVGKTEQGAPILGRGAFRDPLEGFLRNVQDRQWRRALHYGLLLAKGDQRDALWGIGLELSVFNLDAEGQTWAFQCALTTLADATREQPEHAAALVALAVENLTSLPHPSLPEPLATPQSNMDSTIRSLLAAPGERLAHLPLVAALAERGEELDPQTRDHLVASAEWMAQRAAPFARPVPDGSSPPPDSSGLDTAFAPGRDSDAEEALAFVIASRGLHSAVISGLLRFGLATDQRPVSVWPIVLVDALQRIAAAETTEAFAPGVAIHVLRFFRLLRRQHGVL